MKLFLKKLSQSLQSPIDENYSIRYFNKVNATVNFHIAYGKIDALDGVQGGPAPIVENEKDFGNEYKKFGISKVRLFQDAAPSTVYLSAIFPDINADANSEKSYNFDAIDDKIKSAVNKGIDILWIAGYDIGKGGDFWINGFVGGRAPKNAEKYASVIKHVLMHFNEGWANGYHYNISKVEFINEGYSLGGFRNEDEFYTVYDAFYDAIKEYNNEYNRNVKIYAPDLPIGKCYYATKAWQHIIHFIEHITSNNKICDAFSIHAYALLPKDEKMLLEMLQELLDYYKLDIPIVVSEWQINDAWQFIPEKFMKEDRQRNAVVASYDTAVKILWQGIAYESYVYRANSRATPEGKIAEGIMFTTDGVAKPCAYALLPFEEMDGCKMAYVKNPLQEYIPILASSPLKAILIANFQPVELSINIKARGLTPFKEYDVKIYVIDGSIDKWMPEEEWRVKNRLSICIDYKLPPYSCAYIVFNESEGIKSIMDIIIEYIWNLVMQLLQLIPTAF